jgi:hypothetical protein
MLRFPRTEGVVGMTAVLLVFVVLSLSFRIFGWVAVEVAAVTCIVLAAGAILAEVRGHGA